MRVTLTSGRHNRKHSFNLVVRDEEILITTAEGQAIASLTVETMETDVETEGEGFKTIPTDNFYVTFQPTKDEMALKNAAMAWVEPLANV